MYDPNSKCPECGHSLSDLEFPQFNKVQRKCYGCGETYYEVLTEAKNEIEKTKTTSVP